MGLAIPAARAGFSMSGPMLDRNMPNRSVLATTVGISRSSLTRTASWIISLESSLRACGACSISRRRCRVTNSAFRKSSIVMPALTEG